MDRVRRQRTADALRVMADLIEDERCKLRVELLSDGGASELKLLAETDGGIFDVDLPLDGIGVSLARHGPKG